MWVWCDVDGNCLVELDVPAAGREHTYEIHVAGLTGWSSREIDGLRLITEEPAHIALLEMALECRGSLFHEPYGVHEYRLGNSMRTALFARIAPFVSSIPAQLHHMRAWRQVWAQSPTAHLCISAPA